MLPLSSVIRSFFVTTVSSSPVLLRPSMALLSSFAHSKSAFLDPDRNRALKYALAKTVYAQFCAGETPDEVKESIQNLKRMGYSGVVLGYAKEVVMDEDETNSVGPPRSLEAEELRRKRNSEEIQSWMDGTMKTVELAAAGDFVALKFTGAGKQTLEHLLRGLPPSPELEKAMVEICEKAKERGVRLLFDAEQQAVQHTIDEWTLDFQRRYNGSFTLEGQPRALVYGTYQAYLLSTPTTLARHLAAAQAGEFVLGVKLVRGAYLGSDPRHLICGSKDETDRMYDSIAESLITRKYGDILTPHPPSPTTSAPQDIPPFPQVDLVLASHNRDSVKKAQAIRNWQVRTGQPRIEIAYAQLQGMADDISCELVQESKEVLETKAADRDPPRVYKYLVWGTIGNRTRVLRDWLPKMVLYMVDTAMSEVLVHLNHLQRHLKQYSQAERAKELVRLSIELNRIFCDSIKELPDGADIMEGIPPESWTQEESESRSGADAHGNEENRLDIGPEAETENDEKVADQLLLQGSEQSSEDLIQVEKAPASSTSVAPPSKDGKHVTLKTRRAVPVPTPEKSIDQSSSTASQSASTGPSEQPVEKKVLPPGKAGVVHIQSPVFENITDFIQFITKRIREGSLQDIIVKSNDKATVVFHHATHARLFCELNKQRKYARFPEGYRITFGHDFYWDDNHLKMEAPVRERRRLTFVKRKLFCKELPFEKWRQHVTSIAGARNVERTFAFNSGNATAIFTSTTVARHVLETFNEWKDTREVYSGLQVSYSYDPCEGDLTLKASEGKPAETY
ncbi:hypothetical protein VTN00DRAFT_582 [Thermoascus crustaceus]|uniref:uncharacterized protein n=1 Tax=Thermoascus crustaceus TaxID=5088 RepID=UPI0037441800